mgnify:CR=1 FL=1
MGVRIEGRGAGAVWTMAQIPENHERIEKLLLDLHKEHNLSKRWQVTFGVLPKKKVI